MTPPIDLFVYGTLRRDGLLSTSYFYDEEIETMRSATMPGKLYSLGGFPAMVPDDGDSHVVGDVVTIHPPFHLLRQLIVMEVSSGYYVASRLARLSNGDLIRCLVFFMEPSDLVGYPRVPGDDFTRNHEIEESDFPRSRGFIASR